MVSYIDTVALGSPLVACAVAGGCNQTLGPPSSSHIASAIAVSGSAAVLVQPGCISKPGMLPTAPCWSCRGEMSDIVLMDGRGFGECLRASVLHSL